MTTFPLREGIPADLDGGSTQQPAKCNRVEHTPLRQPMNFVYLLIQFWPELLDCPQQPPGAVLDPVHRVGSEAAYRCLPKLGLLLARDQSDLLGSEHCAF